MAERDYKKEYQNESPARKRARAARNRARLKVYKKLKEKYGAAKAKKMMSSVDVDHIKPIVSGGDNALSNLRLRDPSENRADKSFLRKRKRNPEKNKGGKS